MGDIRGNGPSGSNRTYGNMPSWLHNGGKGRNGEGEGVMEILGGRANSDMS